MNIINRHNYETFFLLYTDNELSVAERNAVDDFVRSNPDLQEELAMLQQSVLHPDDIVFSGKNQLLKDEFDPSEMQANLLMYLDKELGAAESSQLESVIATDATTQQEWNILQQTKFLPAGDLVVFDHKELLYRKEPGRIVAFPWKRIAAAAVLIGFGLWAGVAYLHKDVKTIDVATKTGTGQKGVKQVLKPAEIKDPSVENSTATVAGPPVIKESQQDVAGTPAKPLTALRENSRIAKKPATAKIGKEVAPAVVHVLKDNNLPKPYFEDINNNERNKTVPDYVRTEKKSNLADPGKAAAALNSASEEKANGYASTTAFTDNSEDNNNRVLYMDEEKIKKTKLGGIFRKVKRVFERNTNIKPGSNNLRVANLEFAIQ